LEKIGGAGATVTETMQAIVLAVIQGLTEFLPISSSAHLILPPLLLGWQDQGLAFDVAVHVGSLVAVVVYFRHDLSQLVSGSWQSIQQGVLNSSSRMLLFLIVATIPAGLAGIVFKDVVAGDLRALMVIAISTLVFGVLLGLADRLGGGRAQLFWGNVCLIGLAQALAIIPGTSRSGITMTAALFCGLGREEAARFSFLLSIPIIAAAGLLQGLELAGSGATVDWSLILTATLVSAVTAYLCVRWFLALIGTMGFMPFVLYRVALGLLLLWLAW
jgi:undecaprenyl-diphosphatase